MRHLLLAAGAVLVVLSWTANGQPPPPLAAPPAPSPAVGAPPPPYTSFMLEPPSVGRDKFVFGPGVDLVALNRRRFETMHEHQSVSNDQQLRRAQLIESSIQALPDRLLANLPEQVSRELFDQLASDPALIMGHQDAGGPAEAMIASAVRDPQNVSIERLTKSCLTIHASSSNPNDLNITFHLYTRRNLVAPYVMDPQVSRQQLLNESPLDPRKPIKWITHGFHTNVDKSEWMVEAKRKILAFEDANVILTDWRRGASPALAFYPKAAANAHVVAKLIVTILRRLRGDIDLHQVHLIGHSLGAHIMGFVGSAFTEDYLSQQQQVLMRLAQEMGPDLSARRMHEIMSRRPGLGQLIGRISACDPALPCFGPNSAAPNTQHRVPRIGESPQKQLAASDWTPSMWTHLRPDSAVFVEVIHSNPGVMGYAEPLGDFDFYPNGNDRQPGCGDSSATNVAEQQAQSRPKRQLSSLVGSIWSRFRGGSSNNEALAQTARQTSSRKGPSWTDYLDKFIKPLKDFLSSYTCSHHRSVDLMVEAMYSEFPIRLHRKRSHNWIADLGANTCQMIGYRCADYKSFRRGLCYQCTREDDCRSFAKMGPTWPIRQVGISRRSIDTYHQDDQSNETSLIIDQRATNKFVGHAIDMFMSGRLLNTTSALESKLAKRVLPTSNQYDQHYKRSQNNMYFLDTAPNKLFCIHHYHLLVKYRWLKLREETAAESFKLVGKFGVLEVAEPLTFYKQSINTYTTLLVERNFVGPIESLILAGDVLKPSQIEYLEISYMSNLDPQIRALNSARLCPSHLVSTAPVVQPALIQRAGLLVHC